MRVPDVDLDGTDGRQGLRPLRGRYLLLLFYQEDATPLCSTELRAFAEDLPLLAELGVEVAGISADTIASHRAFVEKLGGLPFPLLSNPGGVVAQSFGAWDPGERRAVRSVFVVDGAGEIIHTALPYNPANLAEYERVFRVVGFQD